MSQEGYFWSRSRVTFETIVWKILTNVYFQTSQKTSIFFQMTPRELLQVQNNEFILANPEMKAKIVAASRRGSNSKEVTARSSLICVGGEGKDGLQGTLFYYKNQQQWQALTR